MEKIEYKRDCKYFRGDIPCAPHKKNGVKCDDCPYYEPRKGTVLIVKLGAMGNVIRTTALLPRIWKKYPERAIWEITLYPDVLPKSLDKILPFNLETITLVRNVEFEAVINLDKDDYACALAKELKAKEKFGFILGDDGKPAPANEFAEGKFLTGLFDDVSQANEKSYLEEIYEIIGEKFEGEEYILEVEDDYEWKINNEGKKIIGLNTGCGGRWTSRLWSEENWTKLARSLKDAGYYPLLLGGEQESEKNERIAKAAGCAYLGHFPVKRFISLVDRCDAVITAVTMAMHVAIGLKKPLVLINNIFNKNEFELYGRGEVVEPDRPCKCYFSPKCENKEYFCMDYLPPEKVFKAVERVLASR